MRGRHHRLLALFLAASLLIGGAIALFGTLGRTPPPEVDTVWRFVEETRKGIAGKRLSLAEGAQSESSFAGYRTTLLRLRNREGLPERYLLRIRSAYEFVFSTDWRPSSWEMALIAYDDANGERRARVVVAKRLAE